MALADSRAVSLLAGRGARTRAGLLPAVRAQRAAAAAPSGLAARGEGERLPGKAGVCACCGAGA